MPGRPRVGILLLACFVLSAFAVDVGAEEGDAARGKRIFHGCAACHAIKCQGGDAGPDLAGLFGRKAGAEPGYGRYSAALRAADFIWTEEKLEEWLTDPNAFLPGNLMNYSGLANPRDRYDLIAWLKQATVR